MNFLWRDWIIAIGASVILHFSLSMVFANGDEEQAKIKGGGGIEIAMLGDAKFDELMAASETSLVKPAETDKLSKQMENSAVVKAAVETEVHTPPVINAIEPIPVTNDSVASIITNTVQSEKLETITPEKPKKKSLKKEKAKPQKKKIKKHKSKKKKKKTSAKKGSSKKNAKAGINTGRKKGSAKKAKSSKRKTSKTGNGNITNYKGKLRGKIYRRFRPGNIRKARRDAIIAFTITKSGRLVSARVSRSSGSTKLDRAALKAVKKASPFPPLPASYNGSKMVTSVNINAR